MAQLRILRVGAARDRGCGREGAVAMQQQKELGHPDVGDQDLVEVVYADDLEDKEATETLLAAEPKIPDEHRFQLRGIRTQPLAGRQTKTTQYRIGESSRQVRFFVQL
ncbi:hypothetical protein ACMFMG_003647 [Clarireedia jacksonii]